MSDTPISLKSLMTPSKTVTIEFPGFDGMTVDLCYLAREEMMKLRNKCVNSKFSKKTRQLEEDLDEGLFLKSYCKEVIKNWSGLKFKYLEELLLVDISSVDPEGDMPYTVENAIELMKNSANFDSWVTETVGDLENFSGSK
jgi:hypothetical protein